jgi:hypothetical protein
VVVSIIWGLKEQDRSECHHSDFKCKGKTVFDRSFDLNPPPCQTAMLVSYLTNTFFLGYTKLKTTVQGLKLHETRRGYHNS